ncbi:MAG: CotH kinase family protein, partial [Anaerolineales bacterium]|nr:CotH kinase family protein [Anaerolineales bacterium]
EALHADSRTSDPAAWRAELETLFNVPDFLHWLALSAAIQHWDTYGG